MPAHFLYPWSYLFAHNVVYTLILENKITFKFSLLLEHIFNTIFKCSRNDFQHMLKKKHPEFI